MLKFLILSIKAISKKNRHSVNIFNLKVLQGIRPPTDHFEIGT